MPANRSYDVFLLERGTKLTLISQSYNLIQHQPSLTLTRHDTLLYVSKTVRKILDETCQNILSYEAMDCIIDIVEEKIMSQGNFCLPFQYKNVFAKLNLVFPQCIDDLTLSSTNFQVSIIAFNSTYKTIDFFRGYGTSLTFMLNKDVPLCARMLNTTVRR